MSNFKIIRTAMVIVGFTVGYFVLASKELFPQQAPIVELYYPIGIILGFITIYLVNRRYIKCGTSYIVTSTIVLTMFLLVFTLIIGALYGSILDDYYQFSKSNTLIGLIRYEEQKGNFITIHKEMLKQGVFTEGIVEGYHNELGISDRIYNEQYTYNINNSFIIFDWNTRKVIKIKKEDDIVNGAYDYLIKELNVAKAQVDENPIHGCVVTIESGNDYFNVIIYAKDGEFAYSARELMLLN